MSDAPPSAAERAIAAVMLAAFWTAFAALAAGLALWAARQPHPAGHPLLTFGLLGLLAMPLLRVASAIVSAARTRDWTTIAAAVAVLAILLALTIRDAARH